MRRRSGPDVVVDPTTGCWLWQHAKDKHGYGRTCANGKMALAHRMYYENANGPVPSGLDLDHLCRNPPCVNPAHLEAVSHGENCRRGAKAKLTWEDVFAIRASSDSYSTLARRYGVTSAAISNVKNHKRWRVDESTPLVA